MSYECGYCGTTFETIDERACCEAKCGEKQKEIEFLKQIDEDRKKLEQLESERRKLIKQTSIIESRIEKLKRKIYPFLIDTDTGQRVSPHDFGDFINFLRGF